jgi:hypothetical protein
MTTNGACMPGAEKPNAQPRLPQKAGGGTKTLQIQKSDFR